MFQLLNSWHSKGYQHFFPLTLFPLNYEGQQIQPLHLLHYKSGTLCYIVEIAFFGARGIANGYKKYMPLN